MPFVSEVVVTIEAWLSSTGVPMYLNGIGGAGNCGTDVVTFITLPMHLSTYRLFFWHYLEL